MNKRMSDLFNMVMSKLTKDGVNNLADKVQVLTDCPVGSNRLPTHTETCPVTFPLGTIKGRDDLGPVGIRISITFEVEKLERKEVTSE